MLKEYFTLLKFLYFTYSIEIYNYNVENPEYIFNKEMLFSIYFSYFILLNQA